jgi:hypothetical protein
MPGLSHDRMSPAWNHVVTFIFQWAVKLEQFDIRNVTFHLMVTFGECMSEEQSSGSPERPEGRPPRSPAGQPSGGNPEGPKPIWRRTPFLMATPPLTLVMIIAVVGCVSSSSTSSPAASASASAQASQVSGSPSPSPSASASGSPSPPASPPTSAPPTAASTPPALGASCSATVHTYPDSDNDEWYNDVDVNSSQPDTKVIASGGGYSHSWWTNGSGSAVVYLDGPPPGALITVTVGGVTCTVSG